MRPILRALLRPALRPVLGFVLCFAALLAALPCIASAATLCVSHKAHSSCYSTIQGAVNAASWHDVIRVAPGTYAEDVVIGKAVTLLGAGADSTLIDATGLANGIFVDGLSHPGLHGVTIAGFSIRHAKYEGVLLVNTSGATIRDNVIADDDQIPAVFGSGPACTGQPAFETDESGDCGGGLHLIGVTGSIVENNLLTGNGDGLLISDETAESRDNLIVYNVATNNPPECGIVLASHPPVGSAPPNFAKHYGIDHNVVQGNVVSYNGVTVGGAGVGLFSDAEGPGRVSENLIIGNKLIGNGIPGVALHTHVGPAFGAPSDDLNNNQIVGNYIAENGADTGDTLTPDTAGININSGGGGSPVTGTVIALNTITDEGIDVAANTTTEVDAHFNNLLGGKVGAENVCAADNPMALSLCTGSLDATENYWGCAGGPKTAGCSTTSGANVRFTPWLRWPVRGGDGWDD